ncbi:tetratricopeptide repeat protein [Paenibacillus sp. CMAA1364]
MNSEDYIQKAYRSILQNDFIEAIRLFEEAIALYPLDAEIYYKCSITYARNNRIHKGIEYAKRALQLDPHNTIYTLYLQHLKAMYLVQETKKQMEQLQSPTVVELYNMVSSLKEAIELDPLYGEAYVWLALAYSELNEYVSAISTLKEGLFLLPADPGLDQLLVQLKKKFKDYINDSTIG